MANTAFAANDALTKKLWEAKLYKEMARSMHLSGCIDRAGNNIIHEKVNLIKQKGDTITIGLRMRLTSSGQSSSTTGITLEGNEEALAFYDFSVSLSEYGHSVRAGSKLDLQRPAFDLRSEMKEALKEWGAEKQEALLCAAMVSSPTANRYTDQTTTAGNGYLSVADIQLLRRQAKLASPEISPIMVNGKEKYVLFAHPYALKGLKADSDFKSMQLYVEDRGKTNSLITGVIGEVDGVMIVEYDRSALLASGSVCRSVLCGRQALALVWGQYPGWYEKLFDYERIPGVATDMLLGVAKTQFNDEDFGCFTIDNDYVADSL